MFKTFDITQTKVLINLGTGSIKLCDLTLNILTKNHYGPKFNDFQRTGSC